MQIHELALVYDDVILGKNIVAEPFAIIGLPDRFHETKTTMIGDDAFIGSRCTVYQGVKVGNAFDLSDQSTVFYNNEFGDFCRIGPKAMIKNGCRFGSNVRVNAKVFMERTIVGSHVFIGPGVTICDDMHPPCPTNLDCTPYVDIESFVSIGANAVIAPGCKIGHHVQIYSGAVITSDVPPYSVMAGNPAKKIKDFRALVCKEGIFERPFIWWDEQFQ